jgi:RNA polymerase sigma-70 factor (ECF subfamily)
MSASAAPRNPTAFFDAVYDQHRQPIYALFFGHTGDEAVAADLLQEVFLRFWRNVHTLQDMSQDQQRYWLFGVGRNLLTDYYRRQARANIAEQPLEFPESVDAQDQDEIHLVSSEEAPDIQVERQEAMQRLNEAIANLPQHLRTVLTMHVLGEMNSSEIGAALDIPAGTVRYQLSEARKRLAVTMQFSEHVNDGEKGRR